jgi:hypothetical protein
VEFRRTQWIIFAVNKQTHRSTTKLDTHVKICAVKIASLALDFYTKNTKQFTAFHHVYPITTNKHLRQSSIGN